MQEFPCLDDIRATIVRTFQQLANERRDAAPAPATLSIDPAKPPTESVLIRNGHYYGHAFRVPGMIAKLIADNRTIEFYAADGSLLCEMSCDEAAERRPAEARSEAA